MDAYVNLWFDQVKKKSTHRIDFEIIVTISNRYFHTKVLNDLIQDKNFDGIESI